MHLINIFYTFGKYIDVWQMRSPVKRGTCMNIQSPQLRHCQPAASSQRDSMKVHVMNTRGGSSSSTVTGSLQVQVVLAGVADLIKLCHVFKLTHMIEL